VRRRVLRPACPPTPAPALGPLQEKRNAQRQQRREQPVVELSEVRPTTMEGFPGFATGASFNTANPVGIWGSAMGGGAFSHSTSTERSTSTPQP
jgi:hypothetical protein